MEIGEEGIRHDGDLVIHNETQAASQPSESSSEFNNGNNKGSYHEKKTYVKDRDRKKVSAKNNGRISRRYWQMGSVVSCFIANLFAGGLSNSYGVMYTYMKEPLGTTEWELSWIGSLMGGCIGFALRLSFMLVVAILATVCVDCLGCRLSILTGGVLTGIGYIVGSQMDSLYILYFTLGVLPGSGVCIAFTASMVHVIKQFSKWRPLAVGASVSGIAVGVLVWPPLSSAVADNIGWRGTFLINGALTLHFIPCALWIAPDTKPGPLDSATLSIRQAVVRCLQMFKISGAIPISIVYIFLGFSYYTFSNFLPDYLTSTLSKMTLSDAALILSTSGYGGMVSRVVSTGLSMACDNAANYIFLVTAFLCGIANFLVPVCNGSIALHINSALYGLAQGGWTGVYTLVLVRLFGLHKLSKALGINMVFLGLGTFIGAPFQSYLATLFGKRAPFYCAGTSFFFTVMLMMPIVIKLQMTSPAKRDVEGVDNDGFR